MAGWRDVVNLTRNRLALSVLIRIMVLHYGFLAAHLFAGATDTAIAPDLAEM